VIDPARVHYAAVWKPKQGALGRFPNLAVIFNLGAGVDAVVADASLPDVPLVRVAVDDLTRRMTEYVVMHVLMHHRRQNYYAESQQKRVWAPKLQWAAGDLRVGIMGLGVLGRDAAEVLARVGFDVAGWSSTRKAIAGIKCFAGETQLAAFLARTDLLVCLLPLTPQTRGILCRKTFAQLARDGKLGGPVIINAGRGGLQVEDDILACLDDGTLVAATLDVFGTEPLPPDSPFWSHPKVTLSPHNAADTDPDAISRYVAEQIAAFERGEALSNVVDRKVGY
jgi:glyoxylate/hydroxypyruvate reductase A